MNCSSQDGATLFPDTSAGGAAPAPTRQSRSHDGSSPHVGAAAVANENKIGAHV